MSLGSPLLWSSSSPRPLFGAGIFLMLLLAVVCLFSSPLWPSALPSQGDGSTGSVAAQVQQRRGLLPARALPSPPNPGATPQAQSQPALSGPLPFAQPQPMSAGGECPETYGVLPCSTSAGGNLFLMLVYGYLVLVAAKLISDGSELLLQVLDPGIIGGLLLPVLGALPDTLLVVVSGISGSRAEAQEQVLVGIGVLAGSTVMILTVAWGGSLLAGRCDLVETADLGVVAKDRTLTRPWDVVGTGVTTDEQTRLGARIMVYSTLPYLVMQVPILLHSDLAVQGHWASLVGLAIACVGLVGYCIYQVVSPWLQRMKMGEARMQYIRTLAVRDIYNLASSKTFGALLNADGTANEETLGRVFEAFDGDSSGSLSRSELKALILGMGVRQGAVPQEEELSAWMQEFDVDKTEDLTKEEFILGMSRWIGKVLGSHRLGATRVSLHPLRTSPDLFWTSRTSAARGAYEQLAADVVEGENEMEEEEERVPKTPMQIVIDATLLIAGGALLVAIFADPVVSSISAFSKATALPPFFVAFVACPLASNASELVSSLLFAAKKKKRTISLTYSQVYGAITMNNTLCLGAFLALVFVRGLLWDFSAEVTIIVLITLVVGIVGSSARTFPTWMAFFMLALYPLSLLVVIVLDYGLGWK